ncbi:MAG: NUDIX hydrolase [Candidatus Pacebacteria bacterium]|nr:NUDIX hydrolase [Candidatus Paceibacterota bacterium]MBP9852037.1 NUDIX hydrolase [Candidatus Paceibacterota bacterium]
MSKYLINYDTSDTSLSNMGLPSAVFLVAFDGSNILAIENERGWDIPGGHIEDGETPEEALIREVQEEAGATFQNAKLFAVIMSSNPADAKDKTMYVYTTNNVSLGPLTLSEDVLGREIIEVADLIERYQQTDVDMSDLISHAQLMISKLDHHSNIIPSSEHHLTK